MHLDYLVFEECSVFLGGSKLGLGGRTQGSERYNFWVFDSRFVRPNTHLYSPPVRRQFFMISFGCWKPAFVATVSNQDGWCYKSFLRALLQASVASQNFTFSYIFLFSFEQICMNLVLIPDPVGYDGQRSRGFQFWVVLIVLHDVSCHSSVCSPQQS